jgi:hypothetical protein
MIGLFRIQTLVMCLVGGAIAPLVMTACVSNKEADERLMSALVPGSSARLSKESLGSVLRCLEEFHFINSRWPSNNLEFRAFAVPWDTNVTWSAFIRVDLNPQPDGSLAVVWWRSIFPYETLLRATNDFPDTIRVFNTGITTNRIRIGVDGNWNTSGLVPPVSSIVLTDPDAHTSVENWHLQVLNDQGVILTSLDFSNVRAHRERFEPLLFVVIYDRNAAFVRDSVVREFLRNRVSRPSDSEVAEFFKKRRDDIMAN